MKSAATPKEVRGLFDRIHQASTDLQREDLQQAAQLAIQVEFTTIPAYLTAMYSITNPDTRAYQVLRSVVMEEMFHMSQAANTLVAIGGLPRFTGDAAPVYPGYLPHANPASTPYVGLLRASPEVFEDVFVAIEEPAAPHAPAQGDNYDTIAQLYDALLDGMKQFVAHHGEAALFESAPGGRQRLDIYLGKFGGKPVEVKSLKSAQLGIQQILQQGEGSVPQGQSLVPIEPWATYNQYDQRTDGTYGPIIGTPYEMSHFTKFRSVALDSANFPETYPILSNPRREYLRNPRAAQLAAAFDLAYSIMLDGLQQSFRKPAAGDGAFNGDGFFSVVLPLMHQTMPVLARMLMTTPIDAGGNGDVGPNGAPTFLYQPNTRLDDLSLAIRELMGRDDLEPGQRPTLARCQEQIANMLKIYS